MIRYCVFKKRTPWFFMRPPYHPEPLAFILRRIMCYVITISVSGPVHTRAFSFKTAYILMLLGLMSRQTKTRSVFGETAVIWKRSRKWIQMKTHTYVFLWTVKNASKWKRMISSASLWVIPRLLVHAKSNIVSLLCMFILFTYVTRTEFYRFQAY